MRRVLITHIGLVTIVLLAPAIIDDQKLMMKGLSGGQPCQQLEIQLALGVKRRACDCR
jgi:hypothetical protein